MPKDQFLSLCQVPTLRSPPPPQKKQNGGKVPHFAEKMPCQHGWLQGRSLCPGSPQAAPLPALAPQEAKDPRVGVCMAGGGGVCVSVCPLMLLFFCVSGCFFFFFLAALEQEFSCRLAQKELINSNTIL